MKRTHCVFAGGAAVLLCLTMAMGESISASSDPFVFPPFQGVKEHGQAVSVAYFKVRGYSPATQSVNIAWAVHASPGVKSGHIAIYTLQGRIAAVFPIAGAGGTVVWKLSEKQGMSGVYIAKMTYGSASSRSKLVICK